MSSIDAKEMLIRMENGEHLNLLDVREHIEFYTYNIGGTNIPLGSLNNSLDDIVWNKTDEIIVICKAGLRSATAQSILQQNGYHNIRNLTGGLLALQRAQ
jgi:rhodanese-related sulfurtransferase